MCVETSEIDLRDRDIDTLLSNCDIKGDLRNPASVLAFKNKLVNLLYDLKRQIKTQDLTQLENKQIIKTITKIINNHDFIWHFESKITSLNLENYRKCFVLYNTKLGIAAEWSWLASDDLEKVKGNCVDSCLITLHLVFNN